MASSVNNIAATFATLSISSSSSSSSTSSLNQTVFAHNPIKQNPISASWNPQTYLHKSYKSSLLAMYGPPGPPPLPFQSSILHPPPPRHRHQEMIIELKRHHPSLSVHIGHKLPNIALSFLDPTNKLRTTKLSSLCTRGKGLVVVGVFAAFSPRCNEYVKKMVRSMKSKGTTDSIACVALDNAYVMKAWGEMLAVDFDRMKMMLLSDQHGELFDVLSLRSKRFCLSTLDGVIANIEIDDDNDCDVDHKSLDRCHFLAKNGRGL